MEEQVKNKYLKISYKLFSIDDNGTPTLEEETTDDRPFFFISGFGSALPAFENRVIAIESGKEFDFKLEPAEAFGDYEQSRVLDLEREMFTINGHFDHDNVFVDAIIPLQNEDGNRFMGKVLEITDDHVKVDLNHPLAGKKLQFTGTVDENRDATEEEVQRMIHILSGHEHGEGCGCGHHHDHEHGEGCGCGHHHDHEHGEGCGCGHHHDHEHGEGCGCGHHHED